MQYLNAFGQHIDNTDNKHKIHLYMWTTWLKK